MSDEMMNLSLTVSTVACRGVQPHDSGGGASAYTFIFFRSDFFFLLFTFSFLLFPFVFCLLS